MAVPASPETSFERFEAGYLQAQAMYRRVRSGLDRVNEIVTQSRLAVKRSRELIDAITASRSAPRFSAENGCERELVFSLGAASAQRLSRSDRSTIACVCEELDDIAVWQGTYEARTRFDALLQLFALGQDASTLH